MRFQGLTFEVDEDGNKVSYTHFKNGLIGKVVVVDKGARDRDSDKEWRVECVDYSTFFEHKGIEDTTTDKNEVIELLTIIEREEI
jgi:hypothetical protein